MSAKQRTLRTAGGGLPDAHPRHAAQLPAERRERLPWLVLPAGVAGRSAMLIAPFERKTTGLLTNAEADAVTAMRRRLSGVPTPRHPTFIDPVTGCAVPLVDVEPAWIARQAYDRYSCPVVAFGLGGR